jgi:hypothetical protein
MGYGGLLAGVIIPSMRVPSNAGLEGDSAVGRDGALRRYLLTAAGAWNVPEGHRILADGANHRLTTDKNPSPGGAPGLARCCGAPPGLEFFLNGQPVVCTTG